MTDEDKAIGSEGEELPQPIVQTRRFNASLIWLVPALAAVVGAWLVIRNSLEAGPTITISFQTAEGLESAKTPVKYKNVVIGVVHGIRLSADRDHVLVRVDLQKSADNFATADTRFWVVRPRIGLSGISGVDTLLSGPFIAADIGDSTEPSRDFIGLETPPSVIHGTPGKSFKLHTHDLGSIDVGSPIYYRRLQVGHVSSYRLDENGKGISVEIFIDGPNDQFVNPSTRFWNASGIDVSVGIDGLKVNTESIASVIAGGIAFQDLPAPHDTTPSPADSEFELYGNLATAMLPPDGEPTYIRMRFDQSLRGLAVDAPVEFLGVNIGRVVSINIDYDEKTQRFPIIVGAVIYGQRLGRAQTKLAARAAKHGNDADMSHTFALLVEHGLRAEARSGNLLTGQLFISMDFVPKAPKVAYSAAARPLEIPTTNGSFSKLQERLDSILAKVDALPLDRIAARLDDSLGELTNTLRTINGEVLPDFKNTLRGANMTFKAADDALATDSPLQQNLGLTLEELRRTARSLRAFSDYLGRHPEALIRGRRTDANPPAEPPPEATAPSQSGSKP
ncbi:MAG: intermembrane transport protein PqiB [Steroidobacteraceae bacterium]|jgi:paraquat-inducible protein B